MIFGRSFEAKDLSFDLIVSGNLNVDKASEKEHLTREGFVSERTGFRRVLAYMFEFMWNSLCPNDNGKLNFRLRNPFHLCCSY